MVEQNESDISIISKSTPLNHVTAMIAAMNLDEAPHCRENDECAIQSNARNFEGNVKCRSHVIYGC